MSVNKVILVGNLGQDPETRFSPGGDPVTTFSIATTEFWKDKSGERQEKTEWHRIVCFKRLAEYAGETLKKGQQIYLEGKLTTRKWVKDGVPHQTTEVVMESFEFLGKKTSDAAPAATDNASPPSRPAAPQAKSNFDNFDDDVPFQRFPNNIGLSGMLIHAI